VLSRRPATTRSPSSSRSGGRCARNSRRCVRVAPPSREPRPRGGPDANRGPLVCSRARPRRDSVMMQWRPRRQDVVGAHKNPPRIGAQEVLRRGGFFEAKRPPSCRGVGAPAELSGQAAIAPDAGCARKRRGGVVQVSRRGRTAMPPTPSTRSRRHLPRSTAPGCIGAAPARYRQPAQRVRVRGARPAGGTGEYG
jgi:hypothetical protein